MIYGLVNVPSKKSGNEIHGHVEGESIYVICSEKGTTGWRNRSSVSIASGQIGDHMLGKPEALRKTVAEGLANAVRLGRDAGYAQAMADIRHLIGVKGERT